MRYKLALLMVFWLLSASGGAALAQPVRQSPSPSLTVTSPSQGEITNGTSVTVNFQVTGFAIVPSNIPLSEAGKHPEVNRPGEGHVHLVLDLLPLAVQYSASPYTFDNVAPGRHQLMVALANNDHSPLAPPVMQMIQFQTTTTQQPAAPNPNVSLQVMSPDNHATISSASVTVNFQVQGLHIVPSNVPVSEAGKHPEVNRPGEGHLHFMLDLRPLVVSYSADPYTFDNLPPGPHQLMVEVTNNDHSSLTPPVVQTVVFQTEGPGVLPVTGTGEGGPWPVLAGLSALGLAAGALALRDAGNKRRSRGGNRPG